VVNNEVDFAERVDLAGITTEILHCRAHRSKVYNGRHSSKVLEKNTSGLERDLTVSLRCHFPVEDGLNIGS